MERGDWKCKCGELNFKRNTKCRKCGDDWMCTCGETNFASRNNCRKCQKSRSSNIIQNSENKRIFSQENISNVFSKFEIGDWICNKCNEHNFKNKSICRKCSNPKPIKQSSDEDLCIVCISSLRTHLVIKCGHLTCCEKCINMMNHCPICRVPYNPATDLLKVFNL